MGSVNRASVPKKKKKKKKEKKNKNKKKKRRERDNLENSTNLERCTVRK